MVTEVKTVNGLDAVKYQRQKKKKKLFEVMIGRGGRRIIPCEFERKRKKELLIACGLKGKKRGIGHCVGLDLKNGLLLDPNMEEAEDLTLENFDKSCKVMGTNEEYVCVYEAIQIK